MNKKEFKICVRCKKLFPRTSVYFYYRNKLKNWFSSWCKNCKDQYRKEHWHIELDAQRIKRGNAIRIYTITDKAVINKRYRETHKELIKDNKRIYKAMRKAKDPIYALQCAVSKLVWTTMKRRRLSKHNKGFWKTIGYTPHELVQHLESKFASGMAWDNMGKWHIDHIKPQSVFYFNTIEDQAFKDCWSLGNLQPLWAAENLEKSNHYSIDNNGRS